MYTFITILCALVVAVIAAPAGASDLDKRAIVIANGNSVRDGKLPDWGFRYHASGYVAKGCPSGTKISTCYEYRLSSDPTKNIQKDRFGNTVQNTTFFSPSHPADGKVRRYTFRMKVDSSLKYTPFDSCPLVGIETPDVNDNNHPMLSYYLDIRDNLAGIYERSNPFTPLESIPLNEFVGKRTYQTWTLKSGKDDGWVSIEINDEATGLSLLAYGGSGQNSWGTYHMRVGTTRFAVSDMQRMKVYWGDWRGRYI